MASEFRELVLGEEFMDLLRDPVAAPAEDVDVEALGEGLEANLRDQLSLYREYLEAANRQKLAMVNGRLNENNALNTESEIILGRLGSLEAARTDLVGKIVSTRPGLGQNPAQIKCEVLYPLFSPSLAQRIKAARSALFLTVEELKRAMSLNRALVENGSRIIHTTIGIMTSVVGRGRTERMSTYTKKGAINVGRIQVRNLINRSI